MYSIHNRDDLEKLKKLQESKSLIKAERLKEKLGKQDFHYDMEEVFEPVTENQKKSQNQTKLESEKQIQALGDSTQTTTQAIQDQTRAIQESSNTLKKNYINQLKKEYKNMIKLQIVIIKLLQILLTQTKLILVSLRQFLICLMTTTKVNLV